MQISMVRTRWGKGPGQWDLEERGTPTHLRHPMRTMGHRASTANRPICRNSLRASNAGIARNAVCNCSRRRDSAQRAGRRREGCGLGCTGYGCGGFSGCLLPKLWKLQRPGKPGGILAGDADRVGDTGGTCRVRDCYFLSTGRHHRGVIRSLQPFRRHCPGDPGKRFLCAGVVAGVAVGNRATSARHRPVGSVAAGLCRYRSWVGCRGGNCGMGNLGTCQPNLRRWLRCLRRSRVSVAHLTYGGTVGSGEPDRYDHSVLTLRLGGSGWPQPVWAGPLARRSSTAGCWEQRSVAPRRWYAGLLFLRRAAPGAGVLHPVWGAIAAGGQILHLLRECCLIGRWAVFLSLPDRKAGRGFVP